MRTLQLNILGVNIQAHCPNSFAYDLLHGCYSAFVNPELSPPHLNYEIHARGASSFDICLHQEAPIVCENDYELMYFFEKSITVEMQKIRTDLLFLHGGALEYQGRCCLFTAPSGSGKSTTTWAALHHGFNYMSDELAPIIPGTNMVACYPHALCLKTPPPPPYDLPPGTLKTAHTLHVPAEKLPCKTLLEPVPLAAVFFVRYDPTAAAPQVRPVTTAESGARLYSNALNLLCHSRYGLDVVIAAASRSRGFELITNNLAASCDLVKQTMSRA